MKKLILIAVLAASIITTTVYAECKTIFTPNGPITCCETGKFINCF